MSTSTTTAPEGAIFCMCNPLLDISAEVPAEYLEKYGVGAGQAILADEKHIPIYSDLVSNFKVDYVAGGSAQNSMRVCQWMLQQPNVTTYVGAVGKDSYAEQLKASATKDGVRVHYMENESVPTGTCAVLVVGKERSLIANLAAANTYKFEHLQAPETAALMEQASYFYISGFFFTVSPESIMHVAKHAAEHNKTFMMNTSAVFVSQFFGDKVAAALPYVDILFGNEDEARALGKYVLKLETEDVAEIARHVAALPKANEKRSRMVVFTQGSLPAIVVQDGQTTEFPVTPAVDPASIVDTNGAGDAFVGGFLSQLVLGKPVAESVRAGHYAAGTVIQHSGCTYPEKPSFN